MIHSRRALLGAAVTAAAGAGLLLNTQSPASASDSTLVGDGVADDAPAMRALLNDLAADGGRLTLPSGAFRLASDVTVPSGTEVAFDGSAQLLVDSGAAVTIEGRVSAPARRIFTGKVTLGSTSTQTLWPQWWGAVGDGSADDTAAIQHALNAIRDSGGGEVELLRGRYLISEILRIYEGASLRCDPQTVILRGAATSGIFINGDAGATYPGYEGHGNITIEGGVLDGNLGSFPDAYSAVSIGHASRIVVRNVEFRDVSWAHALEINSSDDVLIEDCRFFGFMDSPDGSRFYSEAIQIDIPTALSFPAFGAWDGTPSRNVTIRRNSFGASGTDGTIAWPCGIGEHGAVHDVFSGAVRIESNTFDGATYYAVRTFQWRDCQITNNLFTNCNGGIAVSTATPNSLSTQDVNGVQQGNSQPNSRLLIADNIFRDIGGSGAIAAYGRDHALNDGLQIASNLVENCSGSAIRISYARESSVNGNTIRNARRGVHVDGLETTVISDNLITGSVVNGMEVTNGTDLVVAQNTIHRAGYYGMLYSGAASLLHITDNVIMGPSQTEAARYDGIFLSGAVAGGEVARNHVRSLGSTALRYGVHIADDNDDLRVTGNVGTELKNLSQSSPDGLRLVSPNGTHYYLAIEDKGKLSVMKEGGKKK